jgi:hypothetical protein
MKPSLLFVVIVLSAGSLFAREPAWVFNNGPDARLISLGQGQLHYEVGLTKLIPTGTDLTLTVPMGANDAFPAGSSGRSSPFATSTRRPSSRPACSSRPTR